MSMQQVKTYHFVCTPNFPLSFPIPYINSYSISLSSLLGHMQIVKPQMYHPICGAFLFAKRNFIENENKITADALKLEMSSPK